MQISRTLSDASAMSTGSFVPAAIARSTPASSIDGGDIDERNEAEMSSSSASLCSPTVETQDISVAEEVFSRTQITPPIARSKLNPLVEEFTPEELKVAQDASSWDSPKMHNENRTASEDESLDASSTRVEVGEEDEADEAIGSSNSSRSQSSTPTRKAGRPASPQSPWNSATHPPIYPQLASYIPTDPHHQYTLHQYPSHGNWRGGPLGTDLAPLDVPHLYDQLRPMKIPMDPEIFAKNPEIKPDLHNHLLIEKMWKREAEHATTVNNMRADHQAGLVELRGHMWRIRRLEMRVQQFDGTLRLKDTALANFETRKQAHEKLIEAQDNKIAELEAARATDKKTIAKLQKTIEKLKTKDANKTELTRGQEIALVTKDKTNRKMAERNLELTARLSTLEENALAHEKVVAVLEEKDAEIIAMKVLVAEHEETITSLSMKNYEMEKTIQEDKDAKITADNENAQRASAVRKLEKENMMLKQEKRALSTNCESLRVENDKLKKYKCPPPKKEKTEQVTKHVIADNIAGDVVLIAGGDIHYKTVIMGVQSLMVKMMKGVAKMIRYLFEGLGQQGRKLFSYCALFLVPILVWYFVFSKN